MRVTVCNTQHKVCPWINIEHNSYRASVDGSFNKHSTIESCRLFQICYRKLFLFIPLSIVKLHVAVTITCRCLADAFIQINMQEREKKKRFILGSKKLLGIVGYQVSTMLDRTC